MDIEQKDSITSKVEYKIYNKDGDELDLSVCNNQKVVISYPITNKEKMNFDTGEEMNKEGFDIYNAEDVFFNDKCTSFSNSSLDIVLKDRRKDYYKDVNLCESGCKYEGINYTTSKVNCNCSILEDSTDKSTSKGNFNDIGASLLESTNIGLFKCIVQATSIKSLQSIGFYFCGSITIIQIILAIIFFINGFSKILINFSIQSIPQMQIINQKDSKGYSVNKYGR